MGQAKLRGTFEQRVAQSKTKAEQEEAHKVAVRKQNAEAELVRVSRLTEEEQKAYWERRKRFRNSGIKAMALVAGMSLPVHRPMPVR